MLEEFLTRGTKEVVSTGFLEGEIENRTQRVNLHQVVEEVTVIEPQKDTEVAESG